MMAILLHLTLLVALCCVAIGQEHFLVDVQSKICVYQEGNPDVQCVIHQDVTRPHGLAVDESDGVNTVVYWAQSGKMFRKVLWTDTETEFIRGTTDMILNGLRLYGGFLYFVEGGEVRTVKRIPLTNLLIPAVEVYSGNDLMGVDFFNGTMFFARGQSIEACDIENCAATLRTFAIGPVSGDCVSIGGFRVDPAHQRLYWSYGKCNQQLSIYYANLDGSTLGLQIFTPSKIVFDFAFAEESVFGLRQGASSGERTVVQFDMFGKELSNVNLHPQTDSLSIAHCTTCGQVFNTSAQISPFAFILFGILAVFLSC